MVQRVQGLDLSELRERLNLRASSRRIRESPPLFSSANLNPHYHPVRGLIWSIVVHGFICAALVFVPIFVGIAEQSSLDDAVILRVDELDDVLYLPLLGDSNLESLPETRATVIQPQKGPPRTKAGLSYPGPQPIFSDLADATSETQTLLQPAHANLPVLHSLMLPNLVRMSEPARPLAPLVESKFKTLDSNGAITQPTRNAVALDVPLSDTVRRLAAPVAESRLRLPDSNAPAGPSSAAALPSLDLPLNNTVSAPAAPVPPKPTESTDRKPNSTQDILALSPMPARPDQPVVIPAGEVRGRFAISPQPNLSFPGTEPGTKIGDNDASLSASTANGNTAPAPGIPKGSNVFPGITILGGIDGPGVHRSSTPEPLQTSYGITILSSGGSGGGLRDFGVFGNEQVQTVYLDMRRTKSDRPISWTVQYAVGQKEIVPINGVVNISIKQEVVLPFPITKELPAWPEELMRKYSGRMITAFAVISPEGKAEQPTIKDSPDPLLNEIVLTALRQWTFRPARRDGEVVPAKMLLGIPILELE